MYLVRIVLILTCTFTSGWNCFASDPATRISNYYNSNKRDSALLLIEKHLPDMKMRKNGIVLLSFSA